MTKVKHPKRKWKVSGIVRRAFLSRRHRMENMNSLPPNLNPLRMLLGKFSVRTGLVCAAADQGTPLGVSCGSWVDELGWHCELRCSLGCSSMVPKLSPLCCSKTSPPEKQMEMALIPQWRHQAWICFASLLISNLNTGAKNDKTLDFVFSTFFSEISIFTVVTYFQLPTYL